MGVLIIQRVKGKGAVLYVTPRRELVKQTADRLRKRGISCGIEMGQDRSDEHVTVACYASLQSRRRYERYLGVVKYIIVDEMHLNFSASAMQMLKFFQEHGAKVIGMTATPPSKKDMYIHEHYGDVAFSYDYLTAVEDGWLCSCRMHQTVLEDLDLSRFKVSLGDINQSRVDKLMKTRANVAAIGQMVETYYDGKLSVVFCGSIAQAELVRDDLYGRGIESAIVHSRMDAHEQQRHLDLFVSQQVPVVINVGILTLGWDCPEVRNLFIARMTVSACLYGQMFGRGTRALTGVLDGCRTAEERKAAIAASDKPHFSVYDITDSSRRCDLKTSLDILRPSINDRVVKRVRRVLQRATPVDAAELDEIIADETKALAAEEAARTENELRMRMGIRVDGVVRAYRRDPMADAERGPGAKRPKDYWWMPYGRYKGRGFSKIPRSYLEALLPHVRDANLARNIRTHLRRRDSDRY
jgi:superfamily II DNA or RNA helicase